MKKKAAIGIFLGIACLAVAVAVIVMIRIDNAGRVQWVDEQMGARIRYYAEPRKSEEDFRVDDLESVTELRIDYTGYFETLVDIEKCWNLQSLSIVEYYSDPPNYPEPESPERIVQIEKELAGILEKCDKLSRLWISNTGNTCNLTSLQFLKNGKNLVSLRLGELGDIDYSPILECKSLEILALSYCDISDLGEISRLENLKYLSLNGTHVAEAGDIINLKHLELLRIENTPLAENEEELQLLYEAFPDIEIEK